LQLGSRKALNLRTAKLLLGNGRAEKYMSANLVNAIHKKLDRIFLQWIDLYYIARVI